ncbi:hypothetical protein C8R47DRAFT_1222706 [Mycena vitilis]|nr:hypothetical protein C8R47DRAFT_1222706 [Mycena vitilis]
MSSSSSRPTTRQKHADDTSRLRQAEFEAIIASADKPLKQAPSVSLLSQSDPADRESRVALTGTQYDTLRLLTSRVLTHMVRANVFSSTIATLVTRIGTEDTYAAQALEQKLGSDRAVAPLDISAFVVDHTPTIIFTSLKGESASDIVWGLVAKQEGDNEDRDAQANELFVSSELLRAICDPPPSDLTTSQIDEQSARHKLIYGVTVCHEMVHCITKYFFGPKIITPKLHHFVIDTSGRHGEAGATFEKQYFNFNLEIWWQLCDEQRTDRLWRIDFVAARIGTTTKVLGSEDIDRILRTFQKARIWIVTRDELGPLPPKVSSNTHVRHRVSQSTGEDDPNESEEIQEWSDHVRSTLRCGQRGLGITGT